MDLDKDFFYRPEARLKGGEGERIAELASNAVQSEPFGIKLSPPFSRASGK